MGGPKGMPSRVPSSAAGGISRGVSGVLSGVAPWAAVLLALLLPGASGQTRGAATDAVPKLDLNRFLTAWNVQAWLPNKAETRCVADVDVLYAFGDTPGTFQLGTFCRIANGSIDQWDASGKVDKSGGGKLKLRHWVLFSRPYWVLAAAPDYQWALVGTPDHKSLWILSKTAPIEPGLLAEIERQAAAQGFDTSKLVTVERKAQTQ